MFPVAGPRRLPTMAHQRKFNRWCGTPNASRQFGAIGDDGARSLAFELAGELARLSRPETVIVPPSTVMSFASKTLLHHSKHEVDARRAPLAVKAGPPALPIASDQMVDWAVCDAPQQVLVVTRLVDRREDHIEVHIVRYAVTVKANLTDPVVSAAVVKAERASKLPGVLAPKPIDTT